MSLKDFARRKIRGLDFRNEYVCTGVHGMQQPVKVLWKHSSGPVDVTAQHVMLGYKPLLFGLPVSAKLPVPEEKITLEFGTGDQVIATLVLKRATTIEWKSQRLELYEGTHGEHYFLNRFHRLVNNWMEKMKPDQPGNVDLPGNLYDQVRIAYSLVRPISVVSVGDGQTFNLFPTDLHGAISEHVYADSLRRAGKACAQVEQFKKITVSTIDPLAYQRVYSLGKNHMRDLASISAFEVHAERSPVWGLPVPAYAVSCRDLQWMHSIDLGIHRIHFFDIIATRSFISGDILGHVHRYYAQWRKNHGLAADWLLR